MIDILFRIKIFSFFPEKFYRRKCSTVLTCYQSALDILLQKFIWPENASVAEQTYDSMQSSLFSTGCN